MGEERSTFETTKTRLEDIVTQVRRKDVSEQSLDLLEEAVRLVNQCNELIDQTSWRAPEVEGDVPEVPAEDGAVVSGSLEVFDTDGDGLADTVLEATAVRIPDAAAAEGDRSDEAGTEVSGPADDERE